MSVLTLEHLFDCDLLSRGAVPHLDDVAAGAVAEVAEQLQVVDRRLHANAVQLQQAVLKGTWRVRSGTKVNGESSMEANLI